MTSTEAFFADQAVQDVPRDRYGRYLLPDETGENTGWTRATTFAATLAESYGLRIWEQRQVVWGLSRQPHLLTLASTIAGPEDKKALGAIVDSAHEAGGTKAKANRGSAIHRAIERVETGALRFEDVPEELKPDVYGYFAKLAETGLTILPEYIERTVIVPAYKVAGTFDNVVRCPDGKLRILDKKTGNLDYAEIEFAVQMALYANATAIRDYGTNRYIPMPDVAKDYAIIAHIEPGTGRVELHRINIRLGWAWAATCAEVQDIRKTKHVLTPYVPDGPALPTTAAQLNPAQQALLQAQSIDAQPSPVLNLAPVAPAGIGEQPPIDFDWDQLQDDDDEVTAPPFPATPGAPAVVPGFAPASPTAAPSPGAAHPSSGGAGSPAAPSSAAPPVSTSVAPAIVTEQAAPPVPVSPAAAPPGDAEARAEALVKGAKGKAKLQAIAKDIAAKAGVPEPKLNQHQIRLARDVVAMADAHGISLPVFEKPRRGSAPTEAESAAETELTNHLKYIRTMPTVQGLVEYRASIGDRWTDEHQEAARVRTEELKAQQAANGTPLTPAQIIAGATSPASLQQAWRIATAGGSDMSGWTPELEEQAQAKSTELGVPRGD